jgi:chromosome segregation ATPase
LLEAQTLAEIAEARVVAAEAEAEAATAAAAHLGWKPPHADAPEGKTASALVPSARDFRAELEACEARLASVLETTEREKEKTLLSLQKAEEDAENARKLAESDRVAFAARFGDMNSRAVRLETAFNDAERETAEAKDVIKRLEGKIEELEGKIESQKKKLRKSGGDVESLTEALLADTAAVNERNAALAKELTAARQAKDEVDKKLVAAVAARKETQSKLAESNKLRAELEAQLGKLKDRLEKDIEDAAEQDDKIKSLNGDVAKGHRAPRQERRQEARSGKTGGRRRLERSRHFW